MKFHQLADSAIAPTRSPLSRIEGKRPIFLPDVQQVAPRAFTPAYPAAREQAERYTEPIPREQWAIALRPYTHHDFGGLAAG